MIYVIYICCRTKHHFVFKAAWEAVLLLTFAGWPRKSAIISLLPHTLIRHSNIISSSCFQLTECSEIIASCFHWKSISHFVNARHHSSILKYSSGTHPEPKKHKALSNVIDSLCPFPLITILFPLIDKCWKQFLKTKKSMWSSPVMVKSILFSILWHSFKTGIQF